MAFLRYDISVVGVDRVRQATRAVEAELLASNRRLLGQGTGARRGAARSPQSETRSNSRRILSEEERANRERVRAHEKAERDKTRATLSEARKRDQAQAALQRQRSTALMQQYRLEEAAQRRTRADRIQMTRGVLGGTVSRTAAVGRGAIAATGLAGGAIFAAGMHGAMRKQAAASDLANQLLGNTATVDTLAAKKKDILAAAGATRGFASEDVIAGMSKFQATAGEGEATMKMAPLLARTSLATGSSMEELGDMYASMYAAIRKSSGGAEKSVDQIIAEVEKLGRVFGAMGQVGAIELKDVAAAGSEITAAALSYEGDIKKNIQQVGAMMQIARQTGGAGSAAESSTAVQNFVNDLITKKDEVSKYLSASGGGSMYSDKSKTKLKSLDVLLPELMAATGGDLEKMGDILGIRGGRALKGFTEPYQEAYQAAKKGSASEKAAKEAGKKAVSKRFSEFSGIEMTKGEVEAKAASRLADADKMLEEQMRKLTTTAGEQLLPVLIGLIPELAKLTPYVTSAASGLATLAKFLHENPLSGLATVIGAAFALELGKAKIGSIIGSAVAGGAGGVGGRGAALLGAAGTGAALGVAAYSGISLAGRSDFDAAKQGTNAIMSGLSTMHGAALGQGLVDAKEKLKALEDDKGVFGSMMDWVGAGTGGEIESAKKYVAQKQEEYERYRTTGQVPEEAGAQATQEAIAATDKLTSAIETLNQNLPALTINTSNRPTVPAVK